MPPTSPQAAQRPLCVDTVAMAVYGLARPWRPIATSTDRIGTATRKAAIRYTNTKAPPPFSPMM